MWLFGKFSKPSNRCYQFEFYCLTEENKGVLKNFAIIEFLQCLHAYYQQFYRVNYCSLLALVFFFFFGTAFDLSEYLAYIESDLKDFLLAYRNLASFKILTVFLVFVDITAVMQMIAIIIILSLIHWVILMIQTSIILSLIHWVVFQNSYLTT